jgi:hypothetical protein
MNENLVKNMDEFGYVTYRLNGKLHREDGPAIEESDGEKRWYLEGIQYTEEEFNNKMQIKI